MPGYNARNAGDRRRLRARVKAQPLHARERSRLQVATTGARFRTRLSRIDAKPLREERENMPSWTPDPSFYPSPRQAAKAPPETLAYVAAFDPDRKTADRIAIVDVDSKSASYSKIIGDVVASEVGDEFHHFGWNACSSCLCPNAPHPHVERRYLIVTGLLSSRIYVLYTKLNPCAPNIVKYN